MPVQILPHNGIFEVTANFNEFIEVTGYYLLIPVNCIAQINLFSILKPTIICTTQTYPHFITMHEGYCDIRKDELP